MGGPRGACGMGAGKAAKMLRGSIFWQGCNFFLQKTTKFTSTARKAKRIKVTLCVELSFPPSATLPFGP